MSLEFNLEENKTEAMNLFESKSPLKDSMEVKHLPFQNLPLTAAEKALHEKSLKDAGNYMIAEAVILQDVCDIEEMKLYEKFGYTSTYSYCIKVMKLSEFITNSCIGIARKSKKIPELKQAIDQGELTVSTAVRIVPVLKEENKEEWINKAKTLTKSKLERAVADTKPEAKFEKLKPSSKGRSRLDISISEEFEAEIRRLQEIESKAGVGLASYEQVLQTAVRERLDRIDPLRKAARAKERAEKKK
jgi:hypothetical protein